MYCRYAIDFAIFAKEFLCINQENKFHHITRITSLIYSVLKRSRCAVNFKDEKGMSKYVLCFTTRRVIWYTHLYICHACGEVYIPKERCYSDFWQSSWLTQRGVLSMSNRILSFFWCAHIIALHFMFEYLKTTCENYMKITYICIYITYICNRIACTYIFLCLHLACLSLWPDNTLTYLF